MPISQDAHTVKQFDVQLANLRNMVLEMGGLVEDQIKRAIAALDEENIAASREVIARDRLINGLQVKADEDCVSLIALRQPLGSDLRMIMSFSRAINDLERIGDEAKIIAQKTLSIHARGGRPHDGISLEMDRLATIASQRVQGALDSLARLDVNQAWTLVRADKAEDLFQDILRSLGACPVDGELALASVIDVALALKALQRVADRAQNLAEYVIYIVEGQDVRHGL